MTDIDNMQEGSLREGLSCLKGIKYIVSDVDDTITSNSRLLSTTLSKMEEAKENGYKIILVSGGSAAWCEVYLRQWPVYKVIAESGALLLYRDSDGQVCYKDNPNITDKDKEKRKHLLSLIDRKYLSSDQYARLYDIAVDLKKTPAAELERIQKLSLSMGANCAKSSIHLNIWFGSYSKVNGIVSFFSEEGIDTETIRSESIYLGDSKNDEEAFSFFPLSVGMKSVMDDKESFSHFPRFISHFYGGKGFEEVLSLLVERR